MIKEFELTQEEKTRLFSAGQAEDRRAAINDIWKDIAKDRDFDISTLKQVSPGKYMADFAEKPKEEAQVSLFDMMPEMPDVPEKKVVDDNDPEGTAPIVLKTLVSENFKKLNITIEADGKSFEVRGDNGIGKSSVIDAIFTTLQGMKGSDIEQPIQAGKEEADNIVELEIKKDMMWNDKELLAGTIIRAERVFTSGGNKLSVRVDGKKLTGPKDFMEWIVGASSIADPTVLWDMKPIDLKKYLTQISGVALQLEDIEARKKEIYDSKYRVEQDLERFDKELEDYADLQGEIEEPRFDEIQKSINDREKKRDEIREHEATLAVIQNRIKGMEEEAAKILAGIEDKRIRVEALKEEIKTIVASILSETEHHKGLVGRINDIHGSYDVAGKAKELVETEYAQMPDRSEELQNLQKQQKDFTRFGIKTSIMARRNAKLSEQKEVMESVKMIEDERKGLFSSAKMPIPNLEITDDGVLYKGLPLTKDQISEAEGLELCMDILIAQNPRLRLIACKYGHAFSNKTLKRVLGKAKYRDYQLIIERVSDSDKLEVEFIEL